MGRAEDLFSRIESQGLEAIHGMLSEAKSEEAFLDFKQSGDGGTGRQLCEPDLKNFSKALSGFSNADGGVIVWGVDAPSGPGGDVATGLVPLQNCRNFAARLDDKVSWGTSPPVLGVRSIAIPDQTGTSGYVATLIPQSAVGPHQGTKEKRYYVRAGSSFEPVTHSVLAGMFGRRPQASVHANYLVGTGRMTHVGHTYLIQISLGISAVNTSAVVARDAYMSIAARRLCSASSNVQFTSMDPAFWQRNAAVSQRLISFIAADGKRLAPQSHQAAIEAKFELYTPFTEDFEILIHTGCDGAPSQPHRWFVPLEKLNNLLETELPRIERLGDTHTITHEMVVALLGLQDPEDVAQ